MRTLGDGFFSDGGATEATGVPSSFTISPTTSASSVAAVGTNPFVSTTGLSSAAFNQPWVFEVSPAQTRWSVETRGRRTNAAAHRHTGIFSVRVDRANYARVSKSHSGA